MEHVGSVEQQMTSADETPPAVAPLVGVVVLDRLHHPLPAHLDLSPARDDPGCVVVVLHIDDVVADEEDRDTEIPQLLRETCPQCLAAHAVAADLHVVDEEADERVQIAGVEGDGIAARQLTDLLVCHEPGDRVCARATHGRYPSSRARSWTW